MPGSGSGAASSERAPRIARCPGTIAEVRAEEKAALMPVPLSLCGVFEQSKRVSATFLNCFERRRCSVPCCGLPLPSRILCDGAGQTWRKEFGGLKTDQVKRLKELESEASNATGSREMPNNVRLRKAVSDLTLGKLILRGEAHRPNASGNFVRHCA